MSTPLRVLLVEDSEADAELVLQELRRGGYEPSFERVENEERLNAALARGGWDVVIADHSLPGYSGMAALEAVKRRGDLPFFLVSGTMTEDLVVDAMKAGANDYVMKGRLARLIPAIERELREAGIRRDHRHAQERFRRAFEGSPIGMALVSPDGTFFHVNRALADMLGYSEEELRGRTIRELTHPDDLEASLRNVRDVLEDRVSFLQFEKRYLHKDGRLVWVQISTSALRDGAGEPLYFVTQIQDVTQRREAEKLLQKRVDERTAELRASEERWRSLVANAPDIIITVDREGMIRSINHTVPGFTVEGTVGTSMYDYIAPSQAAEMKRCMDRVLRTGKAERIEVEAAGPNGTRSWYSTRIGPILRDGRVEGATMVSTDITEQKRAETRLVVQYQVTRVLSESDSLSQAIEPILRAICGGLEWDLGAAWIVDGEVLRCQGTWRQPSFPAVEFEAATRKRTFETGVGLPGRVWATRKPAWIPDVTVDMNFPRAPLASREGVRAAFGFPLVVGEQVLGTLEFFSRQVRGPDPGVLEMMEAIGSQLGQFMERKRAEEQARLRKTLLECQGESSIDGILTVSSDGRMISYNRRFLETWGIPDDVVRSGSDDQALASVLDKLVDPDGFLSRVRYLYDHPDEESREEIALRDGRILDRYSAPVRGEDGRYHGRVWFFRDITERRRSEEALRESEERWRSLVANAPDYVATLDRQGTVLFLNRAPGMPAHELIGRPVRELLPARRAEIAQHLARVFEKGESFAFETSFGTPPTWYSARIGPIRKSGRVDSAILIATDVTDQKRAEEEIRQAADSTRRAYDALKRTQNRLIQAEKMASVGMVMAGIAHEINNPLNVIYGNLFLLKGRCGTENPDRRKTARMVADALNAADDAKRVVEEFRHFARDTSSAEPCDLVECVDEAIAAVKPLFGRRIKIERKASAVPPVRLFRGQIRRAIQNLLKNASEAMGGKGSVEVSVGRRAGHAVVEVSDNGRGIDKEHLPRVFEPFFTTKEIGKGFGLGLALCAAVVQNHGGRISVESRPGRGTKFTIRLPLRKS